MQVLVEAREYLTVAEIHERMSSRSPRINLSTVYRTMDRLTALDMVHRLEVPGQARYGSVERPQHHALCTQCEHVVVLEPELAARLLNDVFTTTGMRVKADSGITVRGTCRSCQAATTS